jgi:hypothetical protein
MFRFTPSPVSSASIFWWAGKGGFASRKCLFDVNLDKWFDERFPPLAIYHVRLLLPLAFFRLAHVSACVDGMVRCSRVFGFASVVFCREEETFSS